MEDLNKKKEGRAHTGLTLGQFPLNLGLLFVARDSLIILKHNITGYHFIHYIRITF